jgi:hypothetical protein
MTSAISSRSQRSSLRNPCPVCGRTKDEDCEMRIDGMVFCHLGSTCSPPPEAQRPGDVVTGADGQQWAYLGDSDLGKAMFRLDSPLPASNGNGRGRRPARAEVFGDAVAQAPPAPLPGGPIRLARLPEGAALPDLNRERATYTYGSTQQTRRAPDGKGGKRIRPAVWGPAHPEGCERVRKKAKEREWKEPDCSTWISDGGDEPWPLFQQPLAIAAVRTGEFVLEFEGERCVAIAMAAGLVAISQPGHDHTLAGIEARYRALAADGQGGIVYISDHDAEGLKKAQRCAAAAAATGLPFIHLRAADVWPGILIKGSIDDAPGTPADQVAAIEVALQRHLQQQQPDGAKDGAVQHQGVQASAAAQRGGISPARLHPHEIVRRLPDRLGGQPRLNIRTRDVHLPDGILTGDAAARLYLRLCNEVEKWPKEATFDAVQHLATAASFDPVIEYLNGLDATTEPLPMEEWHRLDLLLFNIDDPVAAAFLPRFFITAVARTFQPGCIGRQWPVLIGEKSIGKSDLPKLLFNVPGLPEGFVDNPGDLQRDGLMKAHRSWCVELAELNGISRRADKEHLKAFLSERTDTFRAPYSRAPASHPRRFVFWGTSNGPPMNEADPRFVCIPLPDRMLPFAAVEAARDAIWARAVAEYRGRTCWHTVTDEFKAALRERNVDHTVTDPWADQVAEYLASRQQGQDLPVTIPDLMDQMNLDSGQRNNNTAARLTELAGSLGWFKGKLRPAPGLPQRLGLWPRDRK